jgi:hypothetical protein
MAKTSKTTAFPLIDAIRPMDSDGPLISLLCSTYGLSLDQPNFFEQDFLPTVLGLGGVRDRGYAVPITLERKLKDVYSALVVDAHALTTGCRPSLQIDLLPVGHRTNHAKVVLIHRKRLIRLVIASANLTHEGYRRQREIGAILEFKDDGQLPVEILRAALQGWSEVLGELNTEPLQRAFNAAIRQAESWALPVALPVGQTVAVMFGGTGRPLWQALVEAWPQGEPLLDWCVCSPFWPDATGGETPFEVIARGLARRGASFEKTRLQIIACADSPGDKGRPKFPFQLARRLYKDGFPILNGQVAAARLDALREEIPEGMAEDQRDLHAKWVVLRGPRTAIILVGSANFTRKGFGVLERPEAANIEACVLFSVPADAMDLYAWMPPLAKEGIVDLSAFQEDQFIEPPPEEDSSCPWPDFIARIEVEVRWQDGPEPVGNMSVVCRPVHSPAFVVSLVPEQGQSPGLPLMNIDENAGLEGSRISAQVDAMAVRKLLTGRAVEVTWGQPAVSASFPVNLDEQSKASLPSVLGARPDEQQLLAYFHGRISEEDLIDLLEQQTARAQASGHNPTPLETERLRKLQSYVLRDFVESLFGLADTLRQSMRSPRAFEQALVGDFSPISLAEQILQSFRSGQRSPTGTAFQFVELVRVVASLQLQGEEPLTWAEQQALYEVRARGLDRLLALAGAACERRDFRQACDDNDFSRYVAASLPLPIAKKWASMVLTATAHNSETQTSPCAETALP